MYKQYIPLGVILILSTALYFIWLPILSPFTQTAATIAFLDVGQGDAILITSPSGKQILIDGGKDSAVLRALGSAMPFWDRTIDMVVATHPDRDHVGGLVHIVDRYDVATILYSGVSDDDNVLQTVEQRMKDTHTVLTARRGQIFDMGDGLYIEVLFPDREVVNMESNTGSIVLRVVYGEQSFLLTGDAPQSIEKYLIQLDGTALDSEVLKAGHHGSKTSSAADFVGIVSPEYVVFSRGCENRYGHPHKQVEDLFSQWSIPTFDTCTEGTITFTTDGRTLEVEY